MTAKEALFRGILDYAGLFPPASLNLPEALQKWEQYQQHPMGWMLGRFVLPADQANQGALLITPPNRVSLLVSGPTLPPLWREVEMVESKVLPDQVPGVPLFVEVDWRGNVAQELDKVAALPGCGVKLRTGGVTSEAVPPAEMVAVFLKEAAARHLPIKFTAGLHLPIPNDDPAVHARMHGFLNVFGAAFAAYAHQAHHGELIETLHDYGYADFTLTDTEFRCGKRTYGVETIMRLRQHNVVSFGSCSFEEPVEHLARNGLL